MFKCEFCNRASQSQAINWDSSDDDTSNTRNINNVQRGKITKNIGHEANSSFNRASNNSSSKKLDFENFSRNDNDSEQLLESQTFVLNTKGTARFHTCIGINI